MAAVEVLSRGKRAVVAGSRPEDMRLRGPLTARHTTVCCVVSRTARSDIEDYGILRPMAELPSLSTSATCTRFATAVPSGCRMLVQAFLVQPLEQTWLRWWRCCDPAPRRGCKPEFGRDPHHDLGLPVGDGDVARLDRVAGRRLDHHAELLNLLGGVRPKCVGSAISSKGRTIKIGEQIEPAEVAD
jgi:hypothetical protein